MARRIYELGTGGMPMIPTLIVGVTGMIVLRCTTWTWPFIALAIYFIVVAVLNTTVIVVTTETLKVRRALGLIRRKIQLDDIAAVHVVSRSWWHVRFTNEWRMFYGLEVVEVRLRNARTFRIVTTDPNGLVAALRDARSVRELGAP
jgi:hypothetical protein